jgi:hypothetical protein
MAHTRSGAWLALGLLALAFLPLTLGRISDASIEVDNREFIFIANEFG